MSDKEQEEGYRCHPGDPQQDKCHSQLFVKKHYHLSLAQPLDLRSIRMMQLYIIVS